MIQPEPITVDGRDGVVVFLDADGQPVDPQSPAAVLARAVFDDGGRATYTVEPKPSRPRELSNGYRERMRSLLDGEGIVLLGGEGSGNFGHAGRPGEVGGSAPGKWSDVGGGGSDEPIEGRRFKGDAGYEWHEHQDRVEWATNLPYDEAKEITNYAGFGYGDINKQLRGQFEPRIINEFVREATPEEIAQYNKGGPDPERPGWGSSAAKRGWPPSKPDEYLPDDPVNKMADGRLVHNVFTEDPKTGEKVEWSIQRAVPDLKYVKELDDHAAKIDQTIREHGYKLPEAIEVHRAAYIPGMSFEDLKGLEGKTIEEKGFTSTMVGDPSQRLDGYVVMGKSESIYKRFENSEEDRRRAHYTEDGSAMRITITLPDGTKVLPVEPVRRLDYEFPRVQNPDAFNHPEWLKNDDGTPNGLKVTDFTNRDFTQKPTVNTKRLTEKDQRSEAEILVGSGARYRIVSVKDGGLIRHGFKNMPPVPVTDVRMEYVGGGSSAGTSADAPPAKKSLRHDLGGEGSGNFGHAGRPGEVGGSASESMGGWSNPILDGRTFNDNEGYEWFEKGPVADWSAELPANEAEAVGSYAGFTYGDINRELRGTFEPRIVDEFVRPATPEEIATYKEAWLKTQPTDYAADDPTNKVPGVEGGRIVHSQHTRDPQTDEKVEWSIKRAAPDRERLDHLHKTTDTINGAIREHGYELPEAMKVNRAAYIPGLSYDDLKEMEGAIIEEPGFTSTMVGNPGKRLNGYVASAKVESIYKRFADRGDEHFWDKHEGEVAAPMRLEITLPKGTKVMPVEAVRRIEYEFPRVVRPVPQHVKDNPYFKEHPENYRETDFTAKPSVSRRMLEDKGSRTEAEILLGSGARFRVVKVLPATTHHPSDPSMKPIGILDVKLLYVGGGSSAGTGMADTGEAVKKLSYRGKLAALVMLGGEGSGNFGHVGRPGEVGGSGSGGGQARAKAGGEYGPNDDWYPGGAFIATSDMPKRERAKIDRMAAKDMEMVDIGGPRQKIAPGQIPIVRDVGTAVNRDFSINETYLDRAGYDDEHKTQIRAAAARAVKGERLFDIKEFPALARVDDVVRLIAADQPVPGAALDRALKYRPDLGKYLVRAKPLSLGGAGSGNFGHAGRPGEVGGSAGEAKDISQRDRKRDERFREMLGKMAEQHHERKAREEEAAARSDVDYQHNTATHADVTARLEALVPRSYVARAGRTKESQIANTAASHVVEVLEEMKAQGYEMPDSVAVHLKPTGGVRGQVVFELGKRSLTINIPKALPADANLNDAVAIAFGGRDDGHERFAVRSMNDVVVHEMGHVQAGSRTKPGQSGLTSAAVQAFPTKDAQHAAMREVSNYAATNPDEFLAESFTRLYRGETLPKNAQRLYDALNGPKVRR